MNDVLSLDSGYLQITVPCVMTFDDYHDLNDFLDIKMRQIKRWSIAAANGGPQQETRHAE